MQGKTKIKLGATAGLRLLPEGKADIILDEVRKFLKTYPFQLDEATGVTILDGKALEQGLHALNASTCSMRGTHTIRLQDRPSGVQSSYSKAYKQPSLHCRELRARQFPCPRVSIERWCILQGCALEDWVAHANLVGYPKAGGCSFSNQYCFGCRLYRVS